MSMESTGTRPTVVTLCGSTRFGAQFREANLRETLAGRIVLTVGCDTRGDDDVFGHLSDEEKVAVKVRLDELHKRKIDLSDEILVIAVGGYVGMSTASEIAYAEAHGKRIRWWDPAMRADTEEEKAAIAEHREGIADSLREMYGPAEGQEE